MRTISRDRLVYSHAAFIHRVIQARLCRLKYGERCSFSKFLSYTLDILKTPGLGLTPIVRRLAILTGPVTAVAAEQSTKNSICNKRES